MPENTDNQKGSSPSESPQKESTQQSPEREESNFSTPTIKSDNDGGGGEPIIREED